MEKIDYAVNGKALQEASRIINGERQTEYGSAENNFALIAKLWNIYCSSKEVYRKREINAHDVAMMMGLMKIARIMSGTQKHDSYVDCLGYFAFAADFADKEEKNVDQDFRADS